MASVVYDDWQYLAAKLQINFEFRFQKKKKMRKCRNIDFPSFTTFVLLEK